MADRSSRYDSAMFWLAFGTAAAVIGLALMTIGVSRSPSGADLLASLWFDVGAGLLAVGAGLLLVALGLFLSRRRLRGEEGRSLDTSTAPGETEAKRDREAIRGYFAERSKLIDRYFDDKAKDKKG